MISAGHVQSGGNGVNSINKQGAKLPWDRRPVTARDMAVVFGFLLFVCVAGAALIALAIGSQPGTALAGEATLDVGVVDTAAVAEGEDAFVQTGSEGAVVEYTLRTEMGGNPAMSFVGVGGAIDGVVNPDLHAETGDTVRLTIVNGNAMLHDLKIDEFDVYSGELTKAEESVTVEFVVGMPGSFNYYCSVPGHRSIGMEGVLHVEGEALEVASGHDHGGAATAPAGDAGSGLSKAAPAVADAVSIVRHPADLPGPLAPADGPQHHILELTAMEVDGVLADGTTFRYMTFNGQVPGPMLRVRVGDTAEIRVHNEMESMLAHSIDLHAVTGPHGGGSLTQTFAGETTTFQFKALKPGLYVYHCATASVAHHISAGMYGMILVEPEEGLPEVDHEFYIMQGEIYTQQPFGTKGHVEFSHDRMLNETADYFVFNGAAGGLLQDEFAMHAEVGDTVRIYFGVGGPNKISSLHLIGEIFDHVYDLGTLTSPPLNDVQTTLVPPGGATVVEFTVEVPGQYLLVDHALSRAERGIGAYLYVEGEPNPEIFDDFGQPHTGGGH